MDNSLSLIQTKVEEIINDSAIFLVNLYVKPTNNIKIFLDGDNGINIESIAQINRAVYKFIEESEMFPNGDFSLEVSSPGIDEPLKLKRQYLKNIGRSIEITLSDEGILTGKLTKVNEDTVELTIIDKKAKETIIKEVPFNQIKTTIVQITF